MTAVSAQKILIRRNPVCLEQMNHEPLPLDNAWLSDEWLADANQPNPRALCRGKQTGGKGTWPKQKNNASLSCRSALRTRRRRPSQLVRVSREDWDNNGA